MSFRFDSPWIGWAALLLVAILCSDSMAQGEPPPVPPGFSGYVQPMVGMVSSRSLNAVGDKNKRIESLDEKADAETTWIPMVLWKAVYTFANEKTRVHAGTPERNIIEGNFFLEAGVSHTLRNGTTLTAAWIPRIPGLSNEAWKDPFLTGREREETDRDSQAFALEVARIPGAPVSLKYTLATQDIDDDRSGASLANQPESPLTTRDLNALQRSGDYHLIEAGSRFPVAPGRMIGASLNYMRGEADGEANSFHNYGGQLTFMIRQPRYEMFNSISFNTARYDEANPVFKEKRDTRRYNAMIGIKYLKPWDVERAYLAFIAGASKKDSEISFYDEESLIVGLGAGCAF